MHLLLHAGDIHASHDRRPILKGVDLSLHRGEVVGLIGTNGAGKSTLMGVLAGLHKHDSGRIIMAGEQYSPDSVAEARACGVGLIEQNFRLDPELTVAQTIFRNTFQADKPHEELRDQAATLIEQIKLELDPDAKISTLIRAEQTLVEVLRMVAEETQLVIMDEVASSLPDHDVAALHVVIRMLTEQGRSIIYITHRLDEVRSIANRIAILREGRVYRIVESNETNVDELAFLLLQQKLERNERPAELTSEDEALRVEHLAVDDQVSDINFSVNKGEIFGLAGTHRSGIYQLVESLAGIRPSTSGTVYLHGKQVDIRNVDDAIQLKIGYLSDMGDGLESGSSIAGALQHSNDDDEFKDEIKQLRSVIELVGRMRINTMSIHGDVSTLSGGDRQKVELARWMTNDCDVLILNHPSRGIDIGAKEVTYKMLTELSQTGVAIIVLSSDMSELVSWCHRIGVMRGGELVAVEDGETTNEDVLIQHMFGKSIGSDGRRGRRAEEEKDEENEKTSA